MFSFVIYYGHPKNYYFRLIKADTKYYIIDLSYKATYGMVTLNKLAKQLYRTSIEYSARGMVTLAHKL